MNPGTVSIQNLSKSYGELTVLAQLNMLLTVGKPWVLMGPSGCGKTTLLRILLGLEAPDTGTVTWDLQMSARSPVSRQRPNLPAVFQEDRLCEAFSPMENILMVTGNLFSRDQISQELCRLLPAESIQRPVHTLSGGMKRRVAILRALLAPGDGVLMDEPFTGLDEDTKLLVISYIKEKTADKLLLITTHQEEDVELLGGTLISLPFVAEPSKML